MTTATPADDSDRAGRQRRLKAKLGRSLRLRRIRAFAATVPLLVFVTAFLLVPIGDMLLRSVHQPQVSNLMPQTTAALSAWGGEDPPGEAAYAALARELPVLRENRKLGQVALRMNHVLPGARSLLFKSASQVDPAGNGSAKAALIAVDDDWGEKGTWAALKRVGEPWTARFYVNSLDYKYNADGQIVSQPEYMQLYRDLFWRTLWASALIAGICLLMGYPLAHLMANTPTRTSNLLLILVLIPFWTSLLVRTSAWIVLLQEQGVVNSLLVASGMIDDQGRLALMYNMVGTIVAMVHIMLPFMILPLYSVMKGISPSYMRAAQALGARPWRAFVDVYLPQTTPGIAAGCLLVFILSIGFYITPALVGGESGQFISSFIAYHVNQSLNWGLAAALAGIVLIGVTVLYFLFNRLIGVENLKLG